MAKSKTPIYLDEELVKQAEAKAAATGHGRDDVVEDAVRRYLLHPADILDQMPDAGLSDDEAIELAIREIKAYRAGK